jgi:hypothetical protein
MDDPDLESRELVKTSLRDAHVDDADGGKSTDWGTRRVQEDGMEDPDRNT